MKAPINKTAYPFFFITDKAMYAFHAPDKMYKIEAIGSNKNPGITIDYYVTRKMVLKHWPYRRDMVTKQRFEFTLKELYGAYFDKVIDGTP